MIGRTIFYSSSLATKLAGSMFGSARKLTLFGLHKLQQYTHQKIPKQTKFT